MHYIIPNVILDVMENISPRKNILYVITKGNWGGAQKYVFDLATSLDPEKYEVSVAFGDGQSLKNHLIKNNIKTYQIPSLKRDISVFKEFIVFIELFRLFKKQKPDVVHLNSSKIGGMGALSARLAGCQNIIFTAHGWAFNENRNIFYKTSIKFLSWLTIILCHKVIVLSENEKKQVCNWPWVRKKISIIPIGIKPINFLEKNIARKIILSKIENTNLENKMWVGSIGELHFNKGYKYAIEAIQKVNTGGIIYIIIGQGEEGKKLKNLIHSLNLENSIFIINYPEKAAELLKAFDIFLLPSEKEGLPYVLLEAGLANLPTISTSVGGTSDIIKTNKTGILIAPKNPAKIAESIDFISNNKELAHSMAETLNRDINTKFNIELIRHQIFALYTK